jgi:N-acetylglucosaminyldiphosphoundecaprenol N-acetyl-beta-D-mannosaminyltransferase
MSRVTLYGVGVDPITLDQSLAWIDETIAGGHHRRIVTLNTTGLMLAERLPFYREFVANADLVVADGQPLVWLAPLFGHRLPARVAGIDLVQQLATQAEARGYSIYLLGAETDTVEAATAELRRRHPQLRIAGHHHGYLGDGAADVAAAIGRSGAAVLLVGMGSPRQERFIDDYWSDLGVNIAIGVGGSFEVLAQRLHRAPRWLQRLGLEWAFRMLQEPRRLARRYLETFVWLTARTLGFGRRTDASSIADPTPPATGTPR